MLACQAVGLLLQGDAFFVGPHADPVVFVGRTDGVIVPARGDAVFGWGEHLLLTRHCQCQACHRLLHLFLSNDYIITSRTDECHPADPIFQPDGFDQTYAEMDKAVKNTISHRYARHNCSILEAHCLYDVAYCKLFTADHPWAHPVES